MAFKIDFGEPVTVYDAEHLKGSADPAIAELTQYPHDVYKVTEWAGSDSGDVDEANARRHKVASPLNADVISSKITGSPLHTLVIDLDVPARLVPSTTEGNSHLYIDVPMAWEHVVAILKALALAGVVEPGYTAVSEDRGETFVRLPWVKKEVSADVDAA